ncbi:WD40-repeat-containing domain protein [Mycena amicta]|nr:WD40-repeat-containing domain protein [Mycena amicta]
MSIVALATANGLALVETSTLRRPPSSLPTSITLLAPPTASAWSTNQLFLASANTIHQYNPTANALTAIFSADADISHLVCRSTSTLVFATADTIHVLESSKLTRTLDSHKSPVTSLSLSNDSLASTSSSAVHLHDLTTGKLTVLRGLGGQTITTCAFHPHTPAKLLVGVGRKLVIFDTTRPSGPSKTIPLNDTTRGEIISVACSPFSKTLVAVATKGGHIGLVDLDKEKGVFRTLNLKVSITCMVFSPEGASLYIGSEMGTVLVVDLRALDKPPRSVSIGASGSRIGTLAVQKKSTKGPTESETKSHTAFNPRLAATAPSASLPLRSVSGNAPPGSPLRKTSTLSPRVFPKK